MRRFVFLTPFTILFLDVACVVAAGEVGAAPPTQPPVLAKFPGTVFSTTRHLDGSVACTTWEGVFLSTADLRQWTAVRNLPGQRGYRLLGGDRRRIFVEESDADGACSLLGVDDDGKVVAVRPKRREGQLAAFASQDIGAVATRVNVSVTSDGGKDWQPSPPIVKKEGEALSALLWVSTSRLVVGTTAGDVELWERQDRGAVRRIWSVAIPAATFQVTLDGDHVWVGSRQLYRLRLSDGQRIASVSTNGTIKGVAACHSCPIVWERAATPAPIDGKKYETMEDLMDAMQKTAARAAIGVNHVLAPRREGGLWTPVGNRITGGCGSPAFGEAYVLGYYG